jgi:hypothetical protein
MRRLEAYLGKRMSDAMREEYFGRLNGQVIDELFPRAIDRLIDDGKSHFIPLVSEIMEAYETERAGINYKEAVHEPCDDCNGTGFFIRDDQTSHAWASPCRCAKGQRILSGWRKRGIDKLIERQERMFYKRTAIERPADEPAQDDFDPEEFVPAAAAADKQLQLEVVEKPNPFDL